MHHTVILYSRVCPCKSGYGITHGPLKTLQQLFFFLKKKKIPNQHQNFSLFPPPRNNNGLIAHYPQAGGSSNPLLTPAFPQELPFPFPTTRSLPPPTFLRRHIYLPSYQIQSFSTPSQRGRCEWRSPRRDLQKVYHTRAQQSLSYDPKRGWNSRAGRRSRYNTGIRREIGHSYTSA